MRAEVESVSPFASSSGELPVSFRQTASRTSPILMIVVLAPLTLALLVPFALLAEHVAGDPAVRAILAARPHSALQLLIALAFCSLLFGWPLARFAMALARQRTIELDTQSVTVSERGIFGKSTWCEPLSAYAGVAHRVRASLSGLRHELVLVHARRSRSVLLAVGPRIDRADIDQVVRQLGLVEISSREAISVSWSGGMLGPSEPQPRLDSARA